MYGQNPYYTTPALQSAQQRLQMMEAQYPQYASPGPMGYTTGYNPQSQQVQTPLLKGRPVSNEEEANAAMIDYDGSLFVFPDKAHGKIYTKQLGLDGNIVFCRYSLEVAEGPVKAVPPGPDMSAYPTREEVKQELSGLHSHIKKLEQQIKGMEEVLK